MRRRLSERIFDIYGGRCLVEVKAYYFTKFQSPIISPGWPSTKVPDSEFSISSNAAFRFSLHDMKTEFVLSLLNENREKERRHRF